MLGYLISGPWSHLQAGAAARIDGALPHSPQYESEQDVLDHHTNRHCEAKASDRPVTKTFDIVPGKRLFLDHVQYSR
jgi:hypothetical protein